MTPLVFPFGAALPRPQRRMLRTIPCAGIPLRTHHTVACSPRYSSPNTPYGSLLSEVLSSSTETCSTSHVQLAVNRQPGYRQKNSKYKQNRQNEMYFLRFHEISRKNDSTKSSVGTLEHCRPLQKTPVHSGEQLQCPVQFCEHCFFVKFGCPKKVLRRPVLGAQCMYEDLLWSKVGSYAY